MSSTSSFKCDFCDYCTVRVHDLRRHVKAMHKSLLTKEESDTSFKNSSISSGNCFVSDELLEKLFRKISDTRDILRPQPPKIDDLPEMDIRDGDYDFSSKNEGKKIKLDSSSACKSVSNSEVFLASTSSKKSVTAVSNKLSSKRQHSDPTTSPLHHKALDRSFEVNGDTALHEAARKNDRELARKALKDGINANTKNDAGFTALHYAALEGNDAIVTYLLKHGALVNAVTRQFETPLHLACEAEHQRVVEILLENRGNPEAVNDKNEKPFDIVNTKWVKIEKKLNNLKNIKELLMPQTPTKEGQISTPERISGRSENATLDQILPKSSILKQHKTTQFCSEDLSVLGASNKDCRSKNVDDVTTNRQNVSSKAASSQYNVSSKHASVVLNESNVLLDERDTNELRNKMDLLFSTVLQLNENAVLLDILKNDLALESDSLNNLERKVSNYRLLIRLKSDDSNAQRRYQKDMDEINLIIDETKQREAKLSDKMEQCKSDVIGFKTRVIDLVKAISVTMQSIGIQF